MPSWEIPQGTTPATQRLWGVIGELDTYVHFREVYALYDEESVIKGDGWVGERFGEDIIEVMASRADIMLTRIKSGQPRVNWGVSPNGEHWR